MHAFILSAEAAERVKAKDLNDEVEEDDGLPSTAERAMVDDSVARMFKRGGLAVLLMLHPQLMPPGDWRKNSIKSEI